MILNLSSYLKKTLTRLTGFYFHNLKTLPIGVDLFYDISCRMKYRSLNIVFDVGANEGQTLKWIKHYQPKAMVFSFEPVVKTFKKLEHNAINYDNCKIENIAFGEVKKTVDIFLFDDLSVLNSLKPELMNNKPDASKESINVVRLDSYCNENNINKIDLLKIDTEGYELEVLHGAGDFLKDGKISFIYCEVGFQQSNVRNTNFYDIISYMENKQYYFYALYQIDSHDWKSGNHLANALFIHKSVYPK